MADQLLNRFLARGTAAQRVAGVLSEPSPVTGPVHGYLWFETDTGELHAWNGSAWARVVATSAGSAGAVILLASLTASASASLNFTTRNAAGQSGAIFQSDYDLYRIEFIHVLPATMTVTGFFRVSTDGGATWISAASSHFYAGLKHGSNPATSSAFNDSSYASTYGLLGGAISNAAGAGLCGTLELWTPTASGVIHAWRVQMGLATNAGSIDEYLVRGWSMNTSAINGIQVAMSSGNIASGRVRIYGIAG